jgi:2-amino-4-hydroxy-6-hydroxymethyldihydropteridine diphosphokinase
MRRGADIIDFAIAVGSNRGDRLASFEQARGLIERDQQLMLLRQSRIHETAPVGGPPGQGAFLNAVWIIRTGLGPHGLLHRFQAIERQCGRVRVVSWGPRTLDLDLLLAADSRCVTTPVLTLPHPFLHQRSFVLAPLREVAGDWWHPLLRCRIASCRWEGGA